MDYGKWRYQQQKKEDKSRASSRGGQLKELKFRTVKIGEHDLLIKVNHAREFLKEGNKVQFTLQFRGREMAHLDLGRDIMNKVKPELCRYRHSYGFGLVLLLPFLFLPVLLLFELMLETPAVFWLPLSLVTTPTFDGALFAFRFLLRLALVSTTLFLVALLLLVVVSAPHAALRLRTARVHRKAEVRRIFALRM